MGRQSRFALRLEGISGCGMNGLYDRRAAPARGVEATHPMTGGEVVDGPQADDERASACDLKGAAQGNIPRVTSREDCYLHAPKVEERDLLRRQQSIIDVGSL